MRVLDAFQVSEKLVEQGRTCEIEFGGKVICKVQVRPADASLNSDYRRVLAELSIGLRQAVKEGGEVDVLADTHRLYQLYSQAVVVGWEWTEPADKKDPKLKFNEKNAVALFTKAPKFFEAIQVAAREWAHYRAAHEASATGN